MESQLRQSRELGFSLIEILVALVILLVNIMGITGLVVRTIQQESESFQRVEAMVILQDMVDRINANRQVHSCYSNGATGRTLGYGVTSISDCGTSTAQNRADADLAAWHAMLQGAEVKAGTDNVGAMIGARGCIEQVDAGQQIYRVTVAWQGLSDTVAPNNTCGQNSYGDETRRRTVSAVVRIGDLT